MDWKTRIAALLFWIFIVLSSVADGNAEKKVVCYYTNWSVYRPGTAKFSPQNINPYLCTHLIYAFGGFTKENTLKPFDKYQDIEKGGYAKFTGLKTYNKDLKTMVAIGGWNEGSSRFSPMVADPQRRKEFVKNTVKFLRQNHFDGLDLDWEYPAFRDGGKPRDKNNYADLVQELRQEFERESSKTGRPRLLLSMAVPAGIEYIDKGYDVPRLNEFLDFVNLLSYDYHSAYEPAANHHSPLYPLEEDNEYNYDTELTIDYTITHLLKSGASPEKIILGIPTYGRSYTLFNEDATDIGAPADGPGEEGDATREKGYLAYYEICESIAKTGEWQVVQPNPSAMGPYAYRGNQWVGYDDEDIVRAKARYVNEKKLGGIMFWSIDNDDFRGKCHGRPYPLIEAAKEAMLTGDEKSHSGTKTRVSSTRKKSRNQAGSRLQVDSISRKSKTDRRTTTEASSTRRRISTSRSNGRFNGKARGNGKVEDNEEDDEEEVNSVKSAEKPRSRARAKNTRSRNQSLGGGRKKLQNSRYNDEKNVEELEEETRSHKLTTPEPPTTPDPGSDFKCEDEGFFPHPRDCKKYFWCLDSGPSGLGIVGHQFTCPSGLVFNKAADSCDYARNVVCPKAKVSQNALTTTKAPITAATSRTTYLHKPTHRTTTPKDESEEEYEYYDDEDEDADDSREIEEEIVSTTTPKTYKTISRNRPTSATTPSSKTTTELSVPSLTKPSKTTTEKVPSYEDEEDPRVIKELIDLIKKAGGIEQLEKQLLYQDKNSGAISESTAENGKSTPATISRSLYERVLNRQATRIAGGFLGSFSTTQTSKSPEVERSTSKNSRTGFINGPGGAQFEGLDQVPEVKTLRRTTKHQYVTIERQRQTTSESPAEDEEEIDEEDENVNKEIASSEDRAVGTTSEEKPSNRRFTPSYVNIRRSRPSTATSENDVDLKEEGEESGEEENEDLEEEGREEPPSKNRKVVTTEEETSAPKPRYTNVQRFRSSTSRHSVDEVTEQVSLRNDLKTSSTSTSTTTEKTVPVTEEITEDPTTPPATSSPVSSSSQTPIEHKFQNATVDANSKEASSTPSEETTKISSESALRLVENSATEILFTTVPASSVSLESNYDSFTRGPTVSPISQPRPFGFSRRGRPTTTAIPPTTATPVTEQTRTKVDEETLRLPTLKELVGFTKTLSNHVTSEFTESPTTNLIVDTTVGNNELRDESDVRLLGKDQLSRYDLSKGGENSSASGALPEESNVEKDTLDNDILSSEEIQRRSSATSFVHSKQTRNDGSTYDRDKNPISSKEIGTVEVPVTILDHTGGEEIAELVLLRVPENRFHSAILKPVFRVKILEQDNESALNDIENTRKAGKLEVFPESSSENELPNNSRTTYGKRGKIGSSDLSEEAETTFEKHQRPKNRPHNRQRIVKARRRTRPLDSLRQNDEIMNVSNSEPGHSQAQIIRISRRRENTDKSATETTTSVPESFENLSNTIVPTTLRGNYSLFSKVSNVTRGFYITRTIDETSTTSDPITTEYWNDPSDDTTLDFTTQNYDFTTRIIEPTTSDLDTTVQTEETGTPVEITVNFSSSSEESSTVQSTSTLLDAFQTSVVDQQLTASLGAVISESLSTETDEIPESTSSWDPKTEKNPINEPEITTFRPRTTKTATTSDGTIPTKSATTGFTVNSLESTDNNADLPNSGEANDDVAQPLDIENSDRISSTTGEPKIVQIEKVPTQDEQDEARTRTLGARSATVSSKITSNRSGTSSTTVEKSKVESTTIPMRNTVYELDTNVKSEAERSSHGTNNFNNATVTISRAGSRRGGVRYTTTAKSPISSDGSSLKSRSKPQKSANGDSVLPTDIITTKSYDATVRNSANQKATQTDPSSLPPSSTPSSRRRGNGKVSTRPLRIAENKSSSSKPSKLQNIEYAVTEDYNHNARSRVHNQPTYSTTNYDQTTVNRAQTLRGSPHGREGRLKTTSIDEAGRFTPTYHETSSISSTEFYEKAIESPEGNESPHSTMNSEQEIVNSLNAAQRISKDSSETQETSEPSSSQKNMDGTSKTPRTFPNNSSETQDTSESFKSHKSINDTSEAAQPFSNDSNKTQETNESLNFYKNINGTSDPKILHELVTEAVTEAYDRTTLSSEALPTTINYETTTTSSSVTPDPTFPVLLNDQETTTTISTLKDLISPVTPPESDGKTLELTMLTDPTIDLITSTVEPTESGILSSQVPGSEITNLPTSNNSNGNVESIKEAPTKILATTDIYEETKSEESTTLSTESTTLESESNTFSTNIDTLDKITESIDSVDTSPPYEVTTSEAKETTYNYEGTSFSVNQGIRDNESEILINTNDGTTKTTMEISQSTTVLYATDDRDEFVTNSADIGRKKVANLPGEAFEDIPPSIISDEQKSYILNKVSEKSTDKTIKTNTTNEKIKSRGKELFLQNDVVPSEATSTTSVYENFVHSTTDVSSTRQASTVEPQMKRPRGRVRFTSFAGSSNDADEQNRRPIKQVVVRRRPAKDRRQNATSLESNSRKSEIASSDINRKTHRAKIQSRNDENSNVKDEYESTKNVEIGKISDENARRDHARITNELNDQRPGEKTNSPKTTRRRVVVYRGRPRPEKIATTAEPVTTTSTTPATVQSSSSSTETLDNKKRRRHKWRKRLVLKRSRVNVEEEDQSIAESGDFRRVFINDRYVENSPDEITTPHIFMPDTLERSSEHEDIAVEASPFKTTGAFLRRPGTLVRNDALKRLRSNVPSTSVPTILPSAKAAPFAKIVTVDPTYEMKTEDQSVRAQEVAVTLSDPPAVDTSPTTGRVGLRTQGTTRKISTTVAPRTEPTSTPRTVSIVRRRQNGLRYNNNLPIVETPVRPRRPAIIDYDYYVDDEIRLVFKPELKDKLFVTKKGGIRCLDQGNFAHPTSCKKFITCARMVNGQVIGTEYTCPDKLSFDPVGGICNWSAGLGCEEKSN